MEIIFKNKKKLREISELINFILNSTRRFLLKNGGNDLKFLQYIQPAYAKLSSWKKTIKIPFVYSHLITNDGGSVIALVNFRRTKVYYQVQFWKNFSRQLFYPMHGEYFCEILIRSVDKYLFGRRPNSTPSVSAHV